MFTSELQSGDKDDVPRVVRRGQGGDEEDGAAPGHLVEVIDKTRLTGGGRTPEEHNGTKTRGWPRTRTGGGRRRECEEDTDGDEAQSRVMIATL